VRHLELDPERAGQPVAKLGLVEVAGGLGVPVDGTAVDRTEPALLVLGHVGHKHVGVKGRITGTRGAMGEGRGHEARGRHELDPSPSSAKEGRVVLEVAERGLGGAGVGGRHMSAHLRISERPQERHRLRGLEGEIEARRAPPGTAGPAHELGVADRIAAVQDRAKLIGSDQAAEAEPICAAPEPASGLLAIAQVVVLGAGGDGGEVVVGASRAEASDAEHRC
jgi:hypothetical protein